MRKDASSDSPLDDSVGFTVPDTRIMKTFRSAESLLKRERYSEAVEELVKLLKSPKDCFLEDENGSTYHSLKSEVFAMIGRMPKKGRQVF